MNAENVDDATERQKNIERCMSMAIVWGANDIATKAVTLGEKVFWRLLREQAIRDFTAAGGIYTPDESQMTPHLLTLPTTPHIVFHERDVALMRAAVKAFDAVLCTTCGHPRRVHSAFGCDAASHGITTPPPGDGDCHCLAFV